MPMPAAPVVVNASFDRFSRNITALLGTPSSRYVEPILATASAVAKPIAPRIAAAARRALFFTNGVASAFVRELDFRASTAMCISSVQFVSQLRAVRFDRVHLVFLETRGAAGHIGVRLPGQTAKVFALGNVRGDVVPHA